MSYIIFFFNDPATTEIYTYGHTLSLHDALPISQLREARRQHRLHGERCRSRHGDDGHHQALWGRTRELPGRRRRRDEGAGGDGVQDHPDGSERRGRSEEHTSELQSLMRLSYAVLCLNKKMNIKKKNTRTR